MRTIRLKNFFLLLLVVCFSTAAVAQQQDMERLVTVKQKTETNGTTTETEHMFTLPSDVTDIKAFLAEQGIELTNDDNTTTEIQVKMTGDASAEMEEFSIDFGETETTTEYITKKHIQKSMEACPYDKDWVKANCPDGWYPGCCEVPQNKAIMGVAVEDADNNGGAFVSEVKADGGAANSNLFAKDIITKIDKAAVSNADDLIKALAKYNPNDKVKVTFLRDNKQKTTKVTLTEHPSAKKNVYYNISEKEDVKIVRLKQGDLEKLLNGEQITMPIAEKNAAATDQISIQLDTDVSVDCPEFNVVITKLDDKDIETISENDKEIDMESMTELDVINLNLYPNPNEGLFELNFRLMEDQPVLVRIISLNGKEVYRENIENFEGTYSNRINITENAAGVYVLQVVQGERMMSRKIIIE